MTHSGYRTKYTDLDKSFSRRRKRISPSEIIEDHLHLSSEAKVFFILEPGHDSLGMNCSNIGDYLDVASAYDWWKDGKTLTMPECRIENSRSLDMGFDRFPSQLLDMGFPPGHSFNTNDFAEPATGSLNFLAHNQLAGGSVNDVSFNTGHPDIDMGFRSPVQHHDPDQRSLDMGFHSPQAQHHDPDQMSLDMGFYSPLVQHRDPEQMSFDMGFNSPVVQHDHPDQRPSGVDPVDILDQSMGLRSEETPLDMGFGTDPAHDLAHQSNIQPEETPLEMASEPEPIGFVIQRAVGDLCLAMHWLEMERAHGTMSLEEALVSEEVLQSTSELLLAFQLISIYRLST
ncbi:uncharacterized protein F5891DRAFT_1197114 [Suillus fuscotomentosus]|uniref:Uncharacterized protein n=1 Tax=Suillus fuscotomentosus TaxID=1912939 RepID=A0AAD4HET0_9AGAM|nr:uncharacterized protein F5891DRAFT_1197114 [Suillus fuscotomentosus]KAG1892844.1 hypothetical protein F5891DRAFT_1197114 [Suillus fuscotomentosus]